MSTYHSPVKPGFEKYLTKIRPKPDRLLAEMERFALRHDVPSVSPDVGELLYLLVGLHRPKRIVECGTAIGMSTLYMARALRDHKIGGRIDTLDVSAERHSQAKDYLKRGGVSRYVEFHTEPAVDHLKRDRTGVDFLFIDAVKEEYAQYVRLCLPRMKKGSVIVADNLLWHGYVPGTRKPPKGFWATSTREIQAFNRAFVKNPKLYARVFPIGDGTGVGVVR